MGQGHRNRRSSRNAPTPAKGMGTDYGHMSARPPHFRRPVSWLAILIGLVLWSGVVCVGYLALDVMLSWLAANSGTALQAGKDAGEGLGVGKQVGAAVERLKSTGIVDQGLSLLRTILLPAAFVIWAVGALVIVTLPRIFGQIGGFLTRRH